MSVSHNLEEPYIGQTSDEESTDLPLDNVCLWKECVESVAKSTMPNSV